MKQARKASLPSNIPPVSERPKPSFLIGAVIFIATGVVVLLLLRAQRASAPKLAGYTKATLAHRDFVLRIADTAESRQQGLSNQPPLSPNEGMLFVFPEPQAACMWMKDMRFDLDIFWFDQTQKLIYQAQNVSRSTYPASFCAPGDSKYVVEAMAGSSANLHLKIGDQLQLEKQ